MNKPTHILNAAPRRPRASKFRPPADSGLLGRLSRLLPVPAVLALFLLVSCAHSIHDYAAEDGEVSRDLVNLPQDLAVYAGSGGNPAPPDGVSPDTRLLTANRQQESVERARSHFFGPWSRSKTGFKQKDAMWALYALKPERGFIENLRPYPPARWAALKENCSPGTFPNRAVRAITLRRVDLRLMPTHSPYFYNPARPGQGYPFDYYQNSSLPAATPVFISHVSKDGAWALVESPSAAGWVDLRDLARVDAAFIKKWTSQPLAAIVSEEVSLTARSGRSGQSGGGSASKRDGSGTAGQESLPPRQESASIGTLLPYKEVISTPGLAGEQTNEQGKKIFKVLFPLRSDDGQAEIGTADIASDNAAAWPLPLTRGRLAELGNHMLAQPYGWGGYGGNRDCSALMRDLFLPFGLWLPRNSGAQAKVGQYTDLSQLTSREKEQRILKDGKPFITMVSMPGHIGLYLGSYHTASGYRAMLFHNVWGIRTKSPVTVLQPAREGRAIIGKAVVTTLSPGEERGDLATPNSLLDRITGMNVIAVE